MDSTFPETTADDDVVLLLNDLSAVQDELLGVLSSKRDRMMAGDLEGMGQLQDREEELSRRLEACQQRRAQLLAEAGRAGAASQGLGRLAQSLEPVQRQRVNQQLQEVNARTQLLRHHSLTNWVLAQRSLIHLSQLLEILATGGRIKPTYGMAESADSRGGLVDEAV